jgi:type I restriction enzyme S subunit
MKVQTRSVSEIADQIRGVTYGKQDATKENRAGYLPVLRAGNITEDGLTYDDLVYVPSGKISDKQRIRKNDIVIAASSGSLDVVGKAARALNEFDGGFGAFCKVLRPRKEVNATYFFHYFKTPEYRKIISSLAAGANINNLRNGDLDDLQIPLPPLDEQKRIAAILDAADALRAKRRQSIAQLDALIQSTFLDLFGDPVTNPMGWEMVTVGSEVDFLTSGSRGWAQYYAEVGDVFIRIQNLRGGVLDLSDIAYVNAPQSAEAKRTKVETGDVLLSITADLGRTAVVPDGIGKAHINQHLAILRFRSMNPTFVSHQIESAGCQTQFVTLNRAAVKAGLNFNDIRSIRLTKPPLPLQQKFAAIVESIERQKTTQRAHLAELDALFAALQHRAFRGEL